MSRVMPRLGTLRLRLSLLFFMIALAAVGFVYAAVVPGLEQRLIDEKLETLKTSVQRYAAPVRAAVGTNVNDRDLDRLVRQAADDASARVSLFYVYSRPDGLQTSLTSDSSSEVEIRDLQFPVALDAARSGQTVTGTEAGPSGRVGEAAEPVFFRSGGRRLVGSVIVLSAPLSDVETSVAVVRRRVLAAGALAVLLALVAGAVAARALSRRVSRLETAAASVARGDFEARFPVDREDELGQLARTLDNMRGQLAELDSARKRFIATASHELRTPIFSLGGFLELLQDEDLDPETRDRFLTQVRQQVDRLGKLATDLLDLSRLEAGSLELRTEPTDISQLAGQVASEFEPALHAHESHLELRLPPEPVETVCDAERVAQVMRILIDNALTHTPPGTDMVVSATRRNGRVRLGVGDFGPGIHRTMLPHIFEPFFTSDDAQGSGLGLAIAHELAERMDGVLRVESHPGRTTFTLELPT